MSCIDEHLIGELRFALSMGALSISICISIAAMVISAAIRYRANRPEGKP
jgi:hypothetical protein